MNTQSKPGCFTYAIGGASFIPLIGIVFGIISIVIGITKNIKPLIILGLSGIVFTIIIYGSIFYFGFSQRGGVYDQMRTQMAVSQLLDLVKEVEYYKIQNGHYPDKIEDLATKENEKSSIIIFDPTSIYRGGKVPHFYYRLDKNDSYFLLSVGNDGIPFTQDDILPSIPEGERSKTGLKITK